MNDKLILNRVTIGADPELFIYNTKTNKVVSSIGLIPGEKGNAYTKGMPKGYGLQIDNILGEFNIPPVNNVTDWLEHMNYMKGYIRAYVKKKNKDLDILCSASQFVDEDQLQSPEAKLFGCSVDYNAYTEKANPKPQGEATNLRSTGLHVHIGYNNPTAEKSIELVKYLDCYMGVPSVLIDRDMNRRTLYGKAGCFRLTKYGVEYRVLSGYFLKDDELLKFVFNKTMLAIRAYKYGFELAPSEEVVECINNGNMELAKRIISRLPSESKINNTQVNNNPLDYFNYIKL